MPNFIIPRSQKQFAFDESHVSGCKDIFLPPLLHNRSAYRYRPLSHKLAHRSMRKYSDDSDSPFFIILFAMHDSTLYSSQCRVTSRLHHRAKFSCVAINISHPTRCFLPRRHCAVYLVTLLVSPTKFRRVIRLS